jgi:heme/copper-type cytochrome/quinol oxidase subunit 4
MAKKIMSKTTSFLWGLLSSLIGGVIVLILLYFLYLKKQKIQVLWMLLGFFALTIVLFAIFGSLLFLGVWQLLGAA